MPFVKLDVGILDSTLWVLRPDREVFITALLMAEPREFIRSQPTYEVGEIKETGFVVPPGWYGFVPASGPGIVSRAHVSREEGLIALNQLGQPEPESRTQDFGGRRMVRVDGGYVILNFMKYRDKDHTGAERARRYRERKKGVATGRDGNERHCDDMTVTRNVTQSEIRDHSHTDPNPSIPSALPTKTDQADSIYDLYPRKQGRKAAIKAICAALKTNSTEHLVERTRAYALAISAWAEHDRQFVPHPATWFNRGSFDDDPETWRRDGGLPGVNGSSYTPRPDIYAEPAGWREKALAKWPDFVLPEKWFDLSSTVRNDLLSK